MRVGRRGKRKINMMMVFYKTVGHFFPKFPDWLRMIDDPRQDNSVIYPSVVMLWTGLLLFLLKLGSRRKLNIRFTGRRFIKNLSFITKAPLAWVPNDGTLNHLLCKFTFEQLHQLRLKLINQLLRNKCLMKYRLAGYYLMAIDGTGYISFDHRHCSKCLTKKVRSQTGRQKLIYYHPLVEVKLVTRNGFAFNVASEIIKNPKRYVKKQACELKVGYRLMARLAKDFLQLKICLLADSLYASKRTLDICKQNKWQYMITLKKGKASELYREYESLKKRCVDNCGQYSNAREEQHYNWVEGINYRFKDKHYVNVLGCRVSRKKPKKNEKKRSKFMWLTNFEITQSNYDVFANQGGRLRWKEENEGFNIQKNWGYNMAHPYSYNLDTLMNYYLLMQIAHTINQLVEKGSLLSKQDWQEIESIETIAFLLLEDLRNNLFEPDVVTAAFTKCFQIRFDSS